MGRRLYYQDSYGYVHRDRKAERAASGGGSLLRTVGLVLGCLALLLVIASAIH